MSLIPPPVSLLAISLITLSISHVVFASEPSGLDLRSDGVIGVASSGLPDLEIRFAVKDVSAGDWGRTVVQEKCIPASGREVERAETYAFKDGQTIRHTTTAKIDGPSVDVATSWTPSNPSTMGFARTDLWFPEELAQDVTVTMGGVKIYPLEEGQARRAITRSDRLVVARKSSGETLFEIDGDFLTVTPFSIADKPELGLSLNFSAVANDVACTVGEATALNWKMTFTK